MTPRWRAALLGAVALAGGCAPPGGTAALRGRDAWVRPVEAGGTTAAYLTLENATASDVIVLSVSTPVSADAQLHATVADGDLVRMTRVDSLRVPAGGALAFEPGGHHIMLMAVGRPLAKGESVPLTLHLAGGNSLAIVARVRR